MSDTSLAAPVAPSPFVDVRSPADFPDSPCRASSRSR